MLSLTVAILFMNYAGNQMPLLLSGYDYEYLNLTDDGWARTIWLPEVVVIAKPLKASARTPQPVIITNNETDNTYWLPEVVITAEPIKEPGLIPKPLLTTTVKARFISQVIAGLLIFYTILLGFGLFARPDMTKNQLQPVRLKTAINHSRGRRRINR